MDLVLRLPAHDDPLLLLLLAQGKGFCVPETMGVWRLHSGGYWSPLSELNRRFALLQFHYSLPALLGSELGRLHRTAVAHRIKKGEEKVAWAVVHGSSLSATFKLLRMMKDSELVPGGRIPTMLGRVALQVAAGVAKYPRALGGRVLRRAGLR
jgi:hypothetical protein